MDDGLPEGMGTRVAKLESDVSHLAADMSDVRATLREMGKDLADTRVRVAKLETKVDHLPGKGFIVSVVATGLALLTAALLLQSKLQHFAGLASAQR